MNSWVEEERLSATRGALTISVLTPPFEMLKPYLLEIEGQDDSTARPRTAAMGLSAKQADTW
jgi:hypothetical protein